MSDIASQWGHLYVAGLLFTLETQLNKAENLCILDSPGSPEKQTQ